MSEVERTVSTRPVIAPGGGFFCNSCGGTYRGGVEVTCDHVLGDPSAKLHMGLCAGCVAHLLGVVPSVKSLLRRPGRG